MNPDAAKFYAKSGEPIRPKLMALAEFAATALNLTIAGPGRLHQYLNGRTVVFEPPRESFRGAFTVSRTGPNEVSIGIGTVNNLVPKIGKVRIDGFDDKGERVKTGIPKLKLAAAGPGLRSYVALKVEVDEETGAVDPENENAVQIVHLAELNAEAIASGHHPLVEAEWQDKKKLTRLRRIVYFDQAHEYRPGADDRPGRHLFNPTP